jgi:hypothetical protein
MGSIERMAVQVEREIGLGQPTRKALFPTGIEPVLVERAGWRGLAILPELASGRGTTAKRW